MRTGILGRYVTDSHVPRYAWKRTRHGLEVQVCPTDTSHLVTWHRGKVTPRGYVSEDEPQGDVEVLCTGALGRKRMVVFKVRNTGSRREEVVRGTEAVNRGRIWEKW